MARQQKPCAACGTPFERNPKYSVAQWARAEFCSNPCRGQALARERPLCACGCGERVAKPSSRWRQGHNPQDHRRKTIKFDGRRWYIHDRHGRKVYWARVVLEGKLGRPLRPGEIAHHVNGDCTDDRPENIELKGSAGQHIREHHQRGDLHAVDWRDRWRK